MIPAACIAPISLARLIDYWLGELDEDAEERIDRHLLGCGECSDRLQQLVALGAGIRMLVRRGAVRAVVTDAFVKRLAAEGLRLREYRVPCNGSVNCTVAPEDEVMVARLEAPLHDVERLDLVVLGFEGTGQQRLRDVPFDAASGEVVLTPRIESIRALPATVGRMQLVAVERRGDRVLGEYTFVHTPHVHR